MNGRFGRILSRLNAGGRSRRSHPLSVWRRPGKRPFTYEQRLQEIFHNLRAEILRRSDAGERQHEVILDAIWKPDIGQTQLPTLARIPVQSHGVCFRTSPMLNIIICFRAEREAKGPAKCAGERQKVQLMRRREHFIKGNRIPDIAPPRTDPLARVPLPDFQIPRALVLKTQIRIELAEHIPIGIVKRIEGQHLIHRAYRADRIAEDGPSPHIGKLIGMNRHGGGLKRLGQ